MVTEAFKEERTGGKTGGAPQMAKHRIIFMSFWKHMHKEVL